VVLSRLTKELGSGGFSLHPFQFVLRLRDHRGDHSSYVAGKFSPAQHIRNTGITLATGGLDWKLLVALGMRFLTFIFIALLAALPFGCAPGQKAAFSTQVRLNANGTTNRIQTFSWDGRGRLHALTERDATNSGYNWTAVYDPLNRRLSTTDVLVTNGYVFAAQSNTINQYFDPQTDCLELGLAYGTKNIWKLYGPDLNGVYGGLNGRGGFDGYTTALGLFFPTLCDARGNVLGYITNGAMVVWSPCRPTAYGAVPGYRPVALGNGANVPQSSAWGGLWPDITGYYNFHRRVYDPITGHWLSGDPEWNELDPNYMTFNGGDPVNHADPDGRLATSFDNIGTALAESDGNNILPTGPEADARMQAWNSLTPSEQGASGIPLPFVFNGVSLANNLYAGNYGPAVGNTVGLLGDALTTVLSLGLAGGATESTVAEDPVVQPTPTTVPVQDDQTVPSGMMPQPVQQQQAQAGPAPTGNGGSSAGGFWMPVPQSGGMQLADNQAVMGIIQNGQIIGLGNPVAEDGLSHLQMAQQLGIDTTGGVLPQGVEGFLVQKINGAVGISGGGISDFVLSPSAEASIQSFFH
jgi:RHS repeat-associated protein